MIIKFNEFPSAFVPPGLIQWVCTQTGFFFDFNSEKDHDVFQFRYFNYRQAASPESSAGITLIIPCQSTPPRNKIYDHLYVRNNDPLPVISPIRQPKKASPVLEEQFSTSQGPAVYNISESTYLLSFDIFYNIWYHLYRLEEHNSPDFEAKNSLLNTYLHTPVVDYFIQFLGEIITELAQRHHYPLVRKSRWPEGKSCALALSHDVDLTRRVGPLSFIKNFFNFKTSWTDRISFLKELIPGNNPFWTFPKLIELYQQHGFQSTFFFISKRFEKHHFRYNIRSRKFRKLFSELCKNGHELALHSSRYSFKNNRQVQWELTRMQSLCNQKISGVRQHYLNCQWPDAFTFFLEQGFLYDSSMAYSETAGFRAGTSLPYPVEPTADGKITEIPFYFFDYHLARVENGEEFIQNLLSALKGVEGLLHILWHPSNLAVQPYSELFFLIISILSDNRHTIWNAHLENILEWSQTWNQIELRPLNSNQYELISSYPIEKLQLKFMGNNKNFSITYEGKEITCESESNPFEIHIEPDHPVLITVDKNG